MENLKDKTNRAYICGEIENAPKFSHEEHGEKFYDMTVKVPRLSGQSDYLPVTISERLITPDMLRGGGQYLCSRAIPLLQQNDKRKIKAVSYSLCA